MEASVHTKWGGKYKAKTAARALGWTIPEGVQEYEDRATLIAQMFLSDKYVDNAAKTLLNVIYHCYEKNEPCRLYYRDTKLNHDSYGGGWGVIFGLLEELGYNVSDREWAFVRGEHDIYKEEVPL